jgi:2-keto-4-pentenoate hydratase
MTASTSLTTIDGGAVKELADQLVAAERERRPIAAPTSAYPQLGVPDAYAIQQLTVRDRLDRGERIVGWKVGLTSKAMQEQLGVDQPDYAPILSGWFVREGDPIPIDGLIQPRVEAEIAFELDRPLTGPGVTVPDVLAATRGVRPAIEVIDSRVADWKITLPDTIADMASSARVIVGEPLTPLRRAAGGGDPGAHLDLAKIGVRFERNGEQVAAGLGAAVLGDPAAAVAWAANTLGALGVVLEAGHIVMPGALHASVPAVRDDLFRAVFDELGSVAVLFV